MSGKICPLMSRARTWENGTAGVEEVGCFEKECQLWEAQTGTCGLVTEGYLAGKAAVKAEIREDSGHRYYTIT